jgi:flagellar protein FlaG
MENKVTAFGGAPDPTFGGKTPDARPSAQPPSRSEQIVSAHEDQRLVIEEDQATGWYMYKTINRHTGEVLLQLPRDELLRLREAARYVVGSLIRAKA